MFNYGEGISHYLARMVIVSQAINNRHCCMFCQIKNVLKKNKQLLFANILMQGKILKTNLKTTQNP
jgi:hypothetical protein